MKLITILDSINVLIKVFYVGCPWKSIPSSQAYSAVNALKYLYTSLFEATKKCMQSISDKM